MPNIVAIVVPFVFGCAFFFGFYFGMIEKDIEHNDDIDDMLARTLQENCTITGIHKTSAENCEIESLNVDEYACSQRQGCTCGCGGGSPSCSTFESNPGSEGNCCNGVDCCDGYSCCQESYFCPVTVCDEYEGCSTEYVYRACCTRGCCEESGSTCYVRWDSCWNIDWNFTMLDAAPRTYPGTSSLNCGFADTQCRDTAQSRYAVNNTIDCYYEPTNTGNVNDQRGTVAFTSPSTWKYYAFFYRHENPSRTYPPYEGSGSGMTFDSLYSSMSASSLGGSGVPCWYDPAHDSVQFTEPNDDDKVNEDRGWAGAAFGLLGWLVSIIMLVLCIINNPCECECERASSSSSRFDKEYYESTEDESARASSSTMELPTSTAVAVSLPSQGELPVASATAVPSSGF